MKKLLPFFCLTVLSLLMIGCSDDDAIAEATATPSTDSYFALQLGNSWQYEVQSDDMPPAQDMLEVTADADAPAGFSNLDSNLPANGFMTTLLATGYVKDELSILRYTGTLEFALDPSNPIQIAIQDGIVYNAEAAAGTILTSVSQSFSQDLDGIPITLDIVASTRQIGRVENYTVGDFTFDSAVQSAVIINATISAEFLGVQVPLLPSQDILIAENTYAKDVGLVQSSVTFSYEFLDLSDFGIDLPVPPSDTRLSNQTLSDFQVSLP